MKTGIDIQDVARIKKLSEDKLRRIFSVLELEYIESKNRAAQTIAGMYAAKEAYFKAIGTGITHNKLREVEILHDDFGAPYIMNNEQGKGQRSVSISISHTKDTAVAVCILGNL